MPDSACPPECRVQLHRIEKEMEGLHHMNEKQWEEIAKRPKLGPMLVIVGFSLSLLGTLLGLIYSQSQRVHADMIKLKIQTERMETKIETHMERSERYRRRGTDSDTRTNTDGGHP